MDLRLKWMVCDCMAGVVKMISTCSEETGRLSVSQVTAIVAHSSPGTELLIGAFDDFSNFFSCTWISSDLILYFVRCHFLNACTATLIVHKGKRLSLKFKKAGHIHSLMVILMIVIQITTVRQTRHTLPYYHGRADSIISSP